MALIDQKHPKTELTLLSGHDVSSDSDSDDCTSLPVPPSLGVSSGINIATIKSAKKVEHTVAHRVEARRSILALVVDDDYLIAGLEGGDIVVCTFVCVHTLERFSFITGAGSCC